MEGRAWERGYIYVMHALMVGSQAYSFYQSLYCKSFMNYQSIVKQQLPRQCLHNKPRIKDLIIN